MEVAAAGTNCQGFAGENAEITDKMTKKERERQLELERQRNLLSRANNMEASQATAAEMREIRLLKRREKKESLLNRTKNTEAVAAGTSGQGLAGPKPGMEMSRRKKAIQKRLERKMNLISLANGMEFTAAGMNCQGVAGGNEANQPSVSGLPNRITKKQKLLQRKREKQERERSNLNKSAEMVRNLEQGGKPRDAADIIRDLSKARRQVRQAQTALMKFRQQKAVEELELIESVKTVAATIRMLNIEKERSRGITTEPKMKKQKKKETKSSKTSASAREVDLEPQSAENEQRSSVNVKEGRGSRASSSSICSIKEELPDYDTFQASRSSENQGPPVQRVSSQHECSASRNWPSAENGFQPFIPKCETCRSVLCCDERIMLHKRLKCSS